MQLAKRVPSVTEQDYYMEGWILHELLNKPDLANPQGDCPFYMVSNAWFEQWKLRVGYSACEMGKLASPFEAEEKIQLPKLNEDLVEPYSDAGGAQLITFKADDEKQAPFTMLNVVVKKGLEHLKAFQAVHEDVWKVIKEHYPKSEEIMRLKYTDPQNPTVPIYESSLVMIEVRFLPNASLRFATSYDTSKFDPKPLKLQISRRMEVSELKLCLVAAAETHVQEKYLPSNFSHKCLNLVLLQEGKTWQDVHAILKESYPSQYSSLTDECTIPGQSLSESERWLGSYKLREEGSILLVEISSAFTFKLKGTVSDAPKQPGTPVVHDTGYNWNQSSAQIVPGKVGLKNMGNTCYMNAALQCLVHTPELKKYFIEDHYRRAQRSMKDTPCQGELAEAFAALMKSIWKPTQTALEPYTLKYQISKKNSEFNNYAQHDSQELLSTMIDGLSEELNLVQAKRPSAPIPQNEGVDPDPRQEWVSFIQREFSVMTHLFYGQCTSTVTCGECQTRSKSVEPFQLLHLGLPVEKYISLLFYFVPEEHRLKADNYTIDVSWNPRDPKTNTIRFFLDEFAKYKNVPADRLKMALLGFKTHGMLLDDSSTLDELLAHMNDKSQSLKVFVLQLSQYEVQLAKRPDAIVFIARSLNKDKALTFSKVIVTVPEETTTYLYDRVFKKFAHFYRSKFDYPSQDYPAETIDYEKFFCERMVYPSATQNEDFKLVLDDNVIKILEKDVTIGELYRSHTSAIIDRDTNQHPSTSAFKKRPITLWIDVRFSEEALSGIEFPLTMKTTAHHEQVSIRSDIKPNLAQALEDYFSEETLREEEKVGCTKCKKKTVSSKKMCLEKLPKYLIIPYLCPPLCQGILERVEAAERAEPSYLPLIYRDPDFLTQFDVTAVHN